jgi:hypothetical protein
MEALDVNANIWVTAKIVLNKKQIHSDSLKLKFYCLKHVTKNTSDNLVR